MAAPPGGFRWRLVGVSQSVITIRTHPLRALRAVYARVSIYRYVAAPRVAPLVGTSRSVSCAITQEAREHVPVNREEPSR